MTRHTHDEGQLVARPVDDEFWFSDHVGYALARMIEQHRPRSGQVVTVDWIVADAA